MIDTLLYFFIGLLFLFVICIVAFIVVILYLFTYDHPNVNGSIKEYYSSLNRKINRLDDKIDCVCNLSSSIISKLSKDDLK